MKNAFDKYFASGLFSRSIEKSIKVWMIISIRTMSYRISSIRALTIVNPNSTIREI